MTTAGPRVGGFTLVELSIVLVVVGLLFGAVLVGRDLIHEAEIRATMRQLESFKTAVNIFRGKYNALPGDMLREDAAQAGVYAVPGVSSGGYGNFNNDGILSPYTCLLETLIFWRHLSDAGLVAGHFGDLFDPAQPTAPVIPSGDPTLLISMYIPPAKIRNTYWVVGYIFTDPILPGYNPMLTTGRNFFRLIVTTDPNFANGGGSTCKPTAMYGVTPAEAFAMDKKLDDGQPNSGKMSNEAGSFLLKPYTTWAATPTDGNCLSGGTSATDTAAVYNVNPSTGGNTRSCAPEFAF